MSDDPNPIDPLTNVRRQAREKLAEHGLALEQAALYIPEDVGGDAYVNLVVLIDPKANDKAKARRIDNEEFQGIVGEISPELQEKQADEARKNLEGLRDRLKKGDGGIL